jgi:hypothetical protein
MVLTEEFRRGSSGAARKSLEIFIALFEKKRV